LCICVELTHHQRLRLHQVNYCYYAVSTSGDVPVQQCTDLYLTAPLQKSLADLLPFVDIVNLFTPCCHYRIMAIIQDNLVQKELSKQFMVIVAALSPLSFVIVMEAISREFRVTLPWELLYADDMVVIAETEEDLIKEA